MSVILKIGCRQPKNWFKRTANKVTGLISFQTNFWEMIKQAMSLGKKKCNASGKGTWIQTRKIESEDLHYNIEWLEIVVQGDREFEKEEYEDLAKFHQPFGKVFKKDMPVDKNLAKHFKTKVLSAAKVDEAYKKGYGSVQNNNLANKLLEMGILTHMEWIDDFDTRNDEIKPDF